MANDDNKSVAAHMAMKARMKGGPRNTITSLQVAVKDATSEEPIRVWPTMVANGAGKLSPSFVEPLMGFPAAFTLPEGEPLHLDPDWGGDPMAAFGRGLEYREPLTVAHADRRAARLKALGNAVVPAVPYVLFRAIEQAERECADGGC
ncbi:MAG: hypothetical protein M3Q74_06395 [Pseudomonadota bacterium]|nr:hypothetical protein [Pseudomonadota bacterium]